MKPWKNRSKTVKRVKLEYEETTITDSAYEQIAAIVQANRVCELCGKAYTPDNPNVELNRCLNCFLRYHENQGFTYITLDLAAFRSGSMNEVLTETEKQNYLHG